MKILQLAVENKRWDLAAHTIILATASILKNGDKPRAGKRVSNNLLLKTSSAKKATKSGGREFERKKGCSKG